MPQSKVWMGVEGLWQNGRPEKEGLLQSAWDAAHKGSDRLELHMFIGESMNTPYQEELPPI